MVRSADGRLVDGDSSESPSMGHGLTSTARPHLSRPEARHRAWGLEETREAEAVRSSGKMPDSSWAQLSLRSCAAQASKLLKNC